MKYIKNIIITALVLVSFIGFSVVNPKSSNAAINLKSINVVDALTTQEQGGRPSSEVFFKVDTEIVKKYRGFSEINAKIYVVDRKSGAMDLLANENILVQYYKDAIINYQAVTLENGLDQLKNGDRIIRNNTMNTAYGYSFKELMQYKTIYSNYIQSSNSLLKIKRV